MAGFARTMSRIADYLRERAGLGATTNDISADLSLHVNHVGGALGLMGRAGTVAWHKIPEGACHNRRRWYSPEFKPDIAPVLRPAPRTIAPVLAQKSAQQPDRSQRMVGGLPEPVQCPCFVDTRFTFEAPPGWVGQITRDWQERRLTEATS